LPSRLRTGCCVGHARFEDSEHENDQFKTHWQIAGYIGFGDARLVGFRGVDEMPSPFASFAVAACLALATLWPLALEGVFATPLDPAAATIAEGIIAEGRQG
jgi:hypothetical protein